MNKKLILKCTILLSFLLPISLSANDTFVTYEFSGGRLGDNLLSYLHAKWISYAYHIPLLYRPFPYSDQMKFHDVEQYRYDKLRLRKIVRTLLQSDDDLQTISPNIIYVCPYFPESEWERCHASQNGRGFLTYFPVDWKNQEFRVHLQELIAPKFPLTPLQLPQNCINIALHIREGGGYDGADLGQCFPTKAPPLSFYIDGLQKIIPLFPNRLFYCFLFTDAKDPTALMQQIQEPFLQNPDIMFACRSENNHHTRNVLEDFFALFAFDILIHPESNFSMVPALIHDYAVTYSPEAAEIGQSVTITKAAMNINDKKIAELLK